MSEATGLKALSGLFIMVYLAAMWMITGGHLNDVAVAAGPIIFSAAAIVFAMLYLSIYHSHLHPEELGYPEKQSKPSLQSDVSRFAAHTTSGETKRDVSHA